MPRIDLPSISHPMPGMPDNSFKESLIREVSVAQRLCDNLKLSLGSHWGPACDSLCEYLTLAPHAQLARLAAPAPVPTLDDLMRLITQRDKLIAQQEQMQASIDAMPEVAREMMGAAITLLSGTVDSQLDYINERISEVQSQMENGGE